MGLTKFLDESLYVRRSKDLSVPLLIRLQLWSRPIRSIGIDEIPALYQHRSEPAYKMRLTPRRVKSSTPCLLLLLPSSLDLVTTIEHL